MIAISELCEVYVIPTLFLVIYDLQFGEYAFFISCFFNPSLLFQICLNIEKREAVVFQDIFDLPEQTQIHDDCLVATGKLMHFKL